MNLIAKKVDPSLLELYRAHFRQSHCDTKHRPAESRLMKMMRTAGGIALCLLIVSFATTSLSKKTSAYKFGLGSDYQAIVALNDNLSKNVPYSVEHISTYNFSGDRRVVAVYRFLERYNSPMASFSVAQAFVTNADKNGFGDKWYILVAISGIESSFGRFIPIGPRGKLSYNAWGWSGGSPYSRWSFFDSWEDAIEKVSYGFGEIYRDTQFVPSKMVSRYCPPCAQDGTKIWEKTVERYSKEILDIYDLIKDSQE